MSGAPVSCASAAPTVTGARSGSSGSTPTMMGRGMGLQSMVDVDVIAIIGATHRVDIGRTPRTACGKPADPLRRSTDAAPFTSSDDGMHARPRAHRRRRHRRAGGPARRPGRRPRLVRVTLVCASPHLTYRALSVEEPFGAPPAGHVAWEHVARDRGVELVHDVVTAVRADRRTVEMRDGPPLRYDSLLLAVGAVPEPPLPGALPFAGQRDVAAVADAIRGLEPGRAHRIVFVAPTPVAWTLPLYELALLTARHARQCGPRPADRDRDARGRAARRLRARGQRTGRPAARPRPASPCGPSPSPPPSRTASCGWSSRARSTRISSSRCPRCAGARCPDCRRTSTASLPWMRIAASAGSTALGGR